MSSSDELCPPPRRCIDEMLEDVARLASPATADAKVDAWLRRLQEDPDALGVLEAARRMRADLPRLLAAASVYVGGRGWLEDPLVTIALGTVRFAPELAHDINRILAEAESIEDLLGRRSEDAEELRKIKTMIDAMDEDVREHEGEVRTTRVPDGKGGWIEKKWIAKGSFVAVGNTSATATCAQAGLRAEEGAPSDPALDVLLILILGHLRAVTGQTRVAFAAELLLNGVKLGDSGGAADPLAAMRARAYRGLRPSRAMHRERARRMAEMLRLAFRWD